MRPSRTLAFPARAAIVIAFIAGCASNDEQQDEISDLTEAYVVENSAYST